MVFLHGEFVCFPPSSLYVVLTLLKQRGGPLSRGTVGWGVGIDVTSGSLTASAKLDGVEAIPLPAMDLFR